MLLGTLLEGRTHNSSKGHSTAEESCLKRAAGEILSIIPKPFFDCIQRELGQVHEKGTVADRTAYTNKRRLALQSLFTS